MRMSRPAAFCAASEVDDPGTRIMSPKVVMMAPSMLASAIAWSMSQLAVTQRGSRATQQLEPGRHNGAKAIAADAHGVRAADFHKVDGAGADEFMDAGFDELAGQLGIAKCRKVDTGASRLSGRH